MGPAADPCTPSQTRALRLHSRQHKAVRGATYRLAAPVAVVDELLLAAAADTVGAQDHSCYYDKAVDRLLADTRVAASAAAAPAAVAPPYDALMRRRTRSAVKHGLDAAT